MKIREDEESRKKGRRIEVKKGRLCEGMEVLRGKRSGEQEQKGGKYGAAGTERGRRN